VTAISDLISDTACITAFRSGKAPSYRSLDVADGS
jgi:hypothetical protein